MCLYFCLFFHSFILFFIIYIYLFLFSQGLDPNNHCEFFFFIQLTEDEHDVSYSDREFDLDEPADVSSFPWSERLGDGFLSPLPSSSRSASLAAPLRAERSGRDTPASVDSIPLEWDHDYDLSRGLESASRALSSEPGDQGEDGYLQGSASALSGQCEIFHPINRRLRINWWL